MRRAFRFVCLVLHVWLAVSGGEVTQQNDSIETKDDTKGGLATEKEMGLLESSSIELESSTLYYGKDSTEKEDLDDTLMSSTESRVENIQRQGELSQDTKAQKQQGFQPDFPKLRPRLRFGQRVRNTGQNKEDEVPLSPLFQVENQRPSRFRNRQTSPNQDSSELSEKLQEPDSSRSDEVGRDLPGARIVPYTSRQLSAQPNPLLNPAFAAPFNNRMQLNRAINPPPPVRNGFYNVAPRNFFDYASPAYRTQFPTSNEVGFSGFARTLSPSTLRLFSSANPFQNPDLLFPPIQSQPILVAPSRNLQPQFSSMGLPTNFNYRDTADFPMPDFTAFNSPDLYGGMNSNEAVDDFGLESNLFFPNYLNPADVQRTPPVAQDQGDQHFASDTSQEDKKSTETQTKPEQANPRNERQDSVAFGNRFRSGEDVFMRYPISEAGYGVEENLPNENKTKEGPAISRTRNFFTRDPYRDALDARQNGTRPFRPEDLFRESPIDFGYQRPPEPVFVMEYPVRSGGRAQYQPLDLQSIAPLNYPFLSGRNDRQESRNPDSQPLCAKANNASFCFQDENYPWNDVLYALDSNTFLMDRMSGSGLEVNVTTFSGTYACDVDTQRGKPLRGRSVSDAWRVIVNTERFSQAAAMEVCRSEGDSCGNIKSDLQTTCVQKYSVQSFLVWSPDRGLFMDLFRIPVACSCQIL